MALIALPTLSAGFTAAATVEISNGVGQLLGGDYLPDVDYVTNVDGYTYSSFPTPLTGTISSNGELNPAWHSWQAFRVSKPAAATIGPGWIGNVLNTGWIRVVLNQAVAINKFVITSINDGNFGRAPKDFTIRASNDNFVSQDVVLDTQTGIVWTQNEAKTYAFANITKYTAFEIRITAIQDPGNAPGIGDIDLRILFDTTSPVFTLTNPLAIGGEEIEQVPLTENNDAGSTITYDYEFDGGGLVTGKTLAQINTAWVGLTPTSLDQFIVHMNSDGNGTPKLNLNGGVLGASGAVCDYAVAADLRLGVEQNFGAIVGTAAIPSADDVEAGVAVDATVGNFGSPAEAEVEENVGFGTLLPRRELTGLSRFDGMLNQVITYWAPDTIDVHGNTSWVAGVEIYGRWQDKVELIQNADGEVVNSRAVVYVKDTQTVEEDSRMYEGAFAAGDPDVIEKAYRVIAIRNIPDVRNRMSRKKVWLA